MDGRPRRELDSGRWAPKGVYIVDTTYYGVRPGLPPEDSLIYEAHVRGLTGHPSSAKLHALLGSVPGLGAHYDVLLCPLVTAWYLLTELGSVVENAGALGAPLPQFLVRAIAVLRADISQHGGGDDDA